VDFFFSREDGYWDSKSYLTGSADTVHAAKNAIKNSVKTLIISEGKI
jgi:hypothetical protein